MLTDHRPSRNGNGHYERVSGVWLHSSFGPQVRRRRGYANLPKTLRRALWILGFLVFVLALVGFFYLTAALNRALHSSGGAP